MARVGIERGSCEKLVKQAEFKTEGPRENYEAEVDGNGSGGEREARATSEWSTGAGRGGRGGGGDELEVEEEQTKALKKELYSRLPKTDMRPVELKMYLSFLV